MAGIWFESFRNHFYNASSRFRPLEGIPREEPPLFEEPAHVDQQASLCFGGCPRLSRSLADRQLHLFDTSTLDLAVFDTLKKRPFNHGPPSAKRNRNMQDLLFIFSLLKNRQYLFSLSLRISGDQS
jgi:hypothetical protein